MNQSEDTPQRDKPDAPIINANGNIFYVLGIASKALKENGEENKSKEMFERATGSTSYAEALAIVCEYINPVDATELHRSSAEKENNQSR